MFTGTWPPERSTVPRGERMTKAFVLVALPVWFTGLCLPASGVRADGLSNTAVVIAHPQQGHLGDPIWLSGAGFPPRSLELLTVVCPRFQQGTQPLGEVFKGGPTTDARGRFKGFQLNVAPLTQVTHPVVCTIYASVGTQPFGPAVKPTYTLLPADRPLDRCEIRMCHVGVVPSPRRVRAGLQESIEVRDGWPGALADITVSCPGHPPVRARTSLDWEGRAMTRLDAHCQPAKSGGSVGASVRVHLSFAQVTGSGSARFTVVR